jgi:hypothetical protein
VRGLKLGEDNKLNSTEKIKVDKLQTTYDRYSKIRTNASKSPIRTMDGPMSVCKSPIGFKKNLHYN